MLIYNMAMKIPKQHLCCCPSLYQSYFAAYSSGTIYHPFIQLLGFPPICFFLPPTSPYVLLKILDSLHDCCLGTPSPHSLKHATARVDKKKTLPSTCHRKISQIHSPEIFRCNEIRDPLYQSRSVQSKFPNYFIIASHVASSHPR